jgi:hypothetical protein
MLANILAEFKTFRYVIGYCPLAKHFKSVTKPLAGGGHP